MTAPFGTPKAEPKRDRWGRPLIKPVDGGAERGYQRVSTYAKLLDDTTGLTKWKLRQVCLGLASSPTLVRKAKAHTADDKRPLDELVEQALERAGSKDKADEGTTLHRLTETLDRGEAVPSIDAPTDAMVAAYGGALRTAGLEVVEAETFVVVDDLEVAGTFDRLLRDPFGLYIGDLKTGNVDKAIASIAVQLALYAHGKKYDLLTGERTEHGASHVTGILIHLPLVADPAEARCDLYYVNIGAGWEAAQLGRKVGNWRKTKFAEVTHPLGGAA